MRWFVCDMDEGVLRVEPTRTAARQWFAGHVGLGDAYVRRHNYGAGDYEYAIGSSEDDHDQCWIIREDRLPGNGWDASQQPLYPVADKPHERVEREEKLP